MTSLPQLFAARLATFAPPSAQQRLLLAVSGGLDSTVLCRLVHQYGYSFAIAHCHFGLRGLESDRDARFVAGLAARYGVPFLLQHFDTAAYATSARLSIQEAARKLRYDWFARLLAGTAGPDTGDGFDWLLTAHHADDNVETVLMNLFKGTGIAGLRGMLPRQGRILRPLLPVRRNELEEWAVAEGLSWVEDSSNAQTGYTRNFFRHQVLPLIEQRIPGASARLLASLPVFAETEELYLQAIEGYRKQLFESKGSEIYIPVLKLRKMVPLRSIVYELFRPFGFVPGQTGTLLQLLDSDTGRYVASQSHQVVRHRRWLLLAPLQHAEATMLVIEKGRDQVAFDGHLLQIEAVDKPARLITPAQIALVDAAHLEYPLVLRRWKQGDYIYPLGMRKKKKLSRLLIDLKMSKPEKERVWVLESQKRIVWVVGVRLDDRFKIGPGTRSVLRFTLSPSIASTPAPRG